MHPPLRSSLLLALLLGACGGEPKPKGLAMLTLDTVDAAALVQNLAAARGTAAIVAGSERAREVAAAARTGHDARLVAIGGDPALVDDGRADAVVLATPRDLAMAATDVTLLAISGVALPPRIEIGARWITKDNRAAGGAAHPSPGDFPLRALCLQHGDLVSRTPATDAIFHVGLVTDDGASALGDALATALGECKQVELHRGDGVAPFATPTVNVIVVAVADPTPHLAACRAAHAGGARIVAVAADLPPDACIVAIRPHTETLGRAAAEAVQHLLAGDGTAIAFGFAADDERHRALAAALRTP